MEKNITCNKVRFTEQFKNLLQQLLGGLTICTKEPAPATLQALKDYLTAFPKAALAFSGGVDSSYLSYAAKCCGLDLHAYYISSQFQPQCELDDATRLANELGIKMTVIPLDILTNETISANPGNRCYHCKLVMLDTILRQAAADGYPVLLDGSNASDDPGDRPGMRALTELKVCSPLRETGLTKDQVRAFSRKAGLFTWDKPAYACLATRVAAGLALDAEILKKIEMTENQLAKMGFTDFRVRFIGNAAKLQLPAEQIPWAAQQHAELLQLFTPYFNDILLDLKPRSGA